MSHSEKTRGPILTSALEFLTEALGNLSAGKVNFAILHAITAVELTLKERLWRLNPGLILKSIDAPDASREQTVSLAALPRRMANLGIPLDQKERDLIRETAQWRHEIVHHVGTFDTARAKQQLGNVLDFIASYLRAHLGMPLENFLPSDLFADANRFIADWQNAVATAAARASDEGNVLRDSCPRCGSERVMTLRQENNVHCHLCSADLFRSERCDGCGRPTLVQHLSLFGDNYCDDCIDAAGDQYIQHQIDLLRGK